MFGFLALGLFIGMAHALEADHLAAIGAMTARAKATPKKLAFMGASWGLGHTTTLLLLSLPVILFGLVVSKQLEAGLEFAVGIMLIGLGGQILWKMHKKRVHFHVHDHGDGKKHIHAHSHTETNLGHQHDPHNHKHGRFSLRAYLVGLAHGAAGSAGLVALAAATTQDVITAIAYVIVFGVGSIFGMAVLTFSASWPLRFVEKNMANLLKFVQLGMACVAITIGAHVMYDAAPILLGVI